MTTLGESIRKHCVECVDSTHAVKDCQGDKMLDAGSGGNHKCVFFKYRLGKGRATVKMVRKECLWCCGGSGTRNKTAGENVDMCPSNQCNLYLFRMGKSPGHAHLSFARD